MLGLEQTIRSQMGGLEAWVISQGIDTLVETRIVLTRFSESKCHMFSGALSEVFFLTRVKNLLLCFTLTTCEECDPYVLLKHV